MIKYVPFDSPIVTTILEFLVQDIGAKARKIMKKVQNDGYTDGPILLGKRVKDFLPRPEELILKDPTTKITITLDSASVDFFKKEAARLNSSYQRMMRNLLTEYANRMRNQDSPISQK